MIILCYRFFNGNQKLHVAHLHKHSEVKLRAELLHFLGQSLLIIAVQRPYLDFLCRQAQRRPEVCVQTFSNERQALQTWRIIGKHVKTTKEKQWQTESKTNASCDLEVWVCFSAPPSDNRGSLLDFIFLFFLRRLWDVLRDAASSRCTMMSG